MSSGLMRIVLRLAIRPSLCDGVFENLASHATSCHAPVLLSDDLGRKLPVVCRSIAPWIIESDRLPERGTFGEAHVFPNQGMVQE